ncbi:copia protein [Tanacetum coccineum]|uniref:Copia protein n=1 Tax=Tanacetum coccineum TaxID=301880 RepID=A0ABQ4ZG64_9ASTR
MTSLYRWKAYRVYFMIMELSKSGKGHFKWNEASRDSNRGRKFTRVSDDGVKFSKLDHFLLNDEFNNLWGNLSVIALDRNLSDHCPIMLKDVDIDFGPKPFRVFNVWVEETDFYHLEKTPYELLKGYSQNSKAYIILNKHTRKVEESLNVTFDETPPPSKTSPLVDDDLDEEEAIKCPLQEAPKTSHLEAVKRILRYIKGTTHLRLWYPKGTDIEIVVYADSDHAEDYVERKKSLAYYVVRGMLFDIWFLEENKPLLIYHLTKPEYVSAEKACQQAL